MPKLPLTTRQAADIAAYVKYAAARPGKDTGLLASAGSAASARRRSRRTASSRFAANPSGQLAYTVKAATRDGRQRSRSR